MSRTKWVLVGGACLAALLVSVSASLASSRVAAGKPASGKHVLLISVDGLHASDLARWVKDNPNSTLGLLSERGTTFTNASTSVPSDSFPGLLALVTGGTPKSTGVYYDNSYDRSLFAPGSSCVGTPGTEVVYDESIDVNDAPPIGLPPGGPFAHTTIDPSLLPLDKTAGGCKPVYPHSFLRVNTIFNVAHDAGLYTAWSDKHPAYDLVQGPSGNGVDDLYVPEINAVAKTENETQTYDSQKVQAVINEIDGRKSACGADFNPFSTCPTAPVPAILGMNFQVVSVAQKQTAATKPPAPDGGYTSGGTQFSTTLATALSFVDTSLGRMVSELNAKDLSDSTEIIITAKHGQSPINNDQLRRLDESTIPDILKAAGIKVAKQTADDTSLLWLADQAQTAAAVAALQASKTSGNPAHIAEVLAGKQLTKQYGDPTKDPRAPDIIVQPEHGVIYSTSLKKQAEHGGATDDDTHVALLLVKPDDKGPAAVPAPVSTTQVAPSILAFLGLNPKDLQAVQREHTTALPTARN